MQILTKIFTAIRGGVREIGETVIDANSIRILEQEISDSDKNLNEAKKDLTTVMAKEMQASRKISELQSGIEKHEGYASSALEKGEESIALDIAGKIAEMQEELRIQQGAQEKFNSHVQNLKAMIKKISRGIADMKRQLVMVKTTESVQKAASTITSSYSSGSSKLLDAKSSLERIKQKQADFEDRMKAGDMLQGEFEGKDLEDKMKKAGILDENNKAKDILDNLRKKKL